METGEPGGVTPVIVTLDRKLGHGCVIVPPLAMEETFALVTHQSLLLVNTVLVT